MRIISIETSGRAGSLSLLEADNAPQSAAGENTAAQSAAADNAAQLVDQALLPGEMRTAQSLAPALQELLARAGWPIGSVGLVAVAIGPGSFTGLRIGVTTAKTLAYALGAEVIGVNTLAVLAAQAGADPAPLWTVLDAQRQELFAARFTGRDDFPPGAAVATQILGRDEWLGRLSPGDRVTGPPLARLAPQLPDGVFPLPEALWQPTAAAVGDVGWAAYRQGQRDDLWKLAPEYYRPSAAEEKAAALAPPPVEP